MNSLLFLLSEKFSRPLGVSVDARALKPRPRRVAVLPFFLAAAALLTVLLGATPAHAQFADITRPGDPITAIGTSPSATDVVANAIDNNTATKYANGNGVGSGFVVTPSRGATIVSGFRFTTGSDAPERDPLTFRLEGSNNGGTSYTILLDNVVTGLVNTTGRQQNGTTYTFGNSGAYTSYRLTVQSVRDTTSNTTAQYSEVALLGYVVKSPLDITTPGDPITLFGGGSNPPEDVTKAIDNNVGTKYLNNNAVGTGFVVTPSKGATIVTGLRIFTGNDAAERDPLTYKLEGSNDGGTTYTTIVATGNTGLATNPGRGEAGDTVTFSNAVSYKTYRFSVLSVRNNPSTNLSQYSDIELLGVLANGAIDVTTPGDPITMFGGTAPGAEGVTNAIDNNPTTKYLNFTSTGTGFVVTPSKGLTVVTGLRLFTGNDSPERDPLNFRLEGSNDGGTTYTTIVDNGITGLNVDPGRQAIGDTVAISNSTYYRTYRFTVLSIRNSGATGAFQFSEIELLGVVAPTVSIASASITEGDTGTKTLNFPLTLSAASTQAVTVTYSTSDGTATAGSDYVAVTNGTATIPAGQTTGNIGITINGDTTLEPNETFTVTLSAATGATLGTPVTATGTITNDDIEAPSLVVSTLNDVTNNADGLTSLREALTYANRTTNQSVETITFSVAGTLRLTSALPSVASATTSGALTISNTQTGNVTLSGDANNSGTNDTGDVRVFSVDANANLTLNNLTMTGGRAEGSSPANSGGAILNNGTLVLTGCTLTNNAAQLGGALWNGGTLGINATSSLSGNTTLNGGSGSALYANAGTASVNGTITANDTVVVVAGATLGGNGTLAGSVSIASGGTHAPGNAGPGLQNTGTYFNNGSLTLDIAGAGAGTGYDQVNVTGTINLAVTLRVALSTNYTPSVGDAFTLINNDGTDAIATSSSGSTEGSLLNSVDGRATFQVSYVGGDGNDLVLTTTSVRANGASPVLISQFRLSGPGGSNDEFIELYNNTNAPLNVSGWTVQAGSATQVLSGTTLIPARGHLLLTGTAYSLTTYSASDIASTLGDIPLTSPLTLLNASGSTVDTVNQDGTLAPDGTAVTATDQYALVRRFETGAPTGAFNLVSISRSATNSDVTGTAPFVNTGRLGAPGPRNLSSPIQSNTTAPLTNPVGITNETAKYSAASVNYNSAASGLSAGGQLSIRRTLTNNTGRAATRLRFRISAITAGTGANAGIADLRAISSRAALLNITGVTVNGLTLEAPSVVAGQGGGLNSSWTTVDLASNPLTLTDGTTNTGGLPAAKAANLEFLFAINNAQGGNYRVTIDVELLP